MSESKEGFSKHRGNGYNTEFYKDPWILLNWLPLYINVNLLPADCKVDVLIQSSSQNTHLLLDMCMPDLVFAIEALDFAQVHCDDKWIWKAHPFGKPVSKGAYHLLHPSKLERCQHSTKVQIFCWKLLHKRLPTADRLIRFNLTIQSNIPFVLPPVNLLIINSTTVPSLPNFGIYGNKILISVLPKQFSDLGDWLKDGELLGLGKLLRTAIVNQFWFIWKIQKNPL